MTALSILNQRKFYQNEDPFLMFLGRYGVNIRHKLDITGERGKAGNRLIPSYPPVFRRDGLELDDLVSLAVQNEFMTEIDVMLDAQGGMEKMREFIRAAIQRQGKTLSLGNLF